MGELLVPTFVVIGSGETSGNDKFSNFGKGEGETNELVGFVSARLCPCGNGYDVFKLLIFGSGEGETIHGVVKPRTTGDGTTSFGSTLVCRDDAWWENSADEVELGYSSEGNCLISEYLCLSLVVLHQFW